MILCRKNGWNVQLLFFSYQKQSLNSILIIREGNIKQNYSSHVFLVDWCCKGKTRTSCTFFHVFTNLSSFWASIWNLHLNIFYVMVGTQVHANKLKKIINSMLHSFFILYSRNGTGTWCMDTKARKDIRNKSCQTKVNKND